MFNRHTLLQLGAEIAACGRELDSWGHTPATSSNFSCRVGSRYCLVTASGKHKGKLLPNDFVVVDWSGTVVDDLSGQQRASAETLLHTQIYETRADVNAVLHTHSPAATLLTMVSPSDELVLENYELLKAFPGVDSHQVKTSVPIVDNSQDMSELRRSVAEFITGRDANALPAYLIRGHGIYTWADSLQRCLNQLEAFEYLLNLELRRLGHG